MYNFILNRNYKSDYILIIDISFKKVAKFASFQDHLIVK